MIHVIRLKLIIPQNESSFTGKGCVKVEREGPGLSLKAIASMKTKSAEINELVGVPSHSWSAFQSLMFAPLSGVWKQAAVGVPIRAHQKAEMDFKKSPRRLRHRYEMIYGSAHRSISSAHIQS